MFLVEKEGFGGLTMSKIAKQAKLATGTLYIYFESKELLINALYLELQENAASRFLANFDKTAPFKNKIKGIWINYFNHRIEFHKESVFLEQYYRSPYISEEQRRIAHDLKKPIINLLKEGQKEGEVKSNIDAALLFYSMLGFIREIAAEHFLGTYTISDQTIEEAFELSWNGIKK
ncbi:TetR/AcrR family transcriptional regulator [Saccharicrinis aurantiacus]|uniref:TetR/AcrR family transcriptional regulator n=1 Tax=Saccharicrinis aurantiacus TaxID=1849719 RepID=UPI001558A666|nr:TetR/AcrR family transcriptional regulator [Saccharicrinis aurantiacus]